MKIKTSLFLTALLIFICCIGAASAAEDISDDSLTIDDEAIVAEQIDDADLQSSESDDAALEVNNAENENLRATSVTVTNWSQLAGNASSSGDKTINLASGVTYTPTSQIVFGNNAKIVGTSTSYISGSYSGIPFYNSNSNYHITFQNVKFKDISCTMLMQMLTTGTTVLDGCTFTNVNASSSGHNSVIYNNYGTMNITDCTFTNCRAAFGVVTNHNAGSTSNVILNVKNSKFQNNYGYTEPGAINNCGQMTVYNTCFIGNHAVWWAGAIHTHSNAYTLINKSYFQDNTAGWNGGALFSYGTLEIYDSCFVDNNCSTNMGGGAIGAYNYGSTYNIYIENCTFKNNHNLNSNGRGGAISTLNGGYLNVYDSTFVANSATTGQAICAYNQHIENGTDGTPYLAIEGCTFENHSGTSDTVYVNGYINAFNDNTFINSPQSPLSGSGNVYNNIVTPISMKSKQELLGVSNGEILGDTSPHETIYVNSSSSNDGTTGRANKKVDGQSWPKAYGKTTGFYWAFMYILYNGDIILADGDYYFDTSFSDWRERIMAKDCNIIGFGDNVRLVFSNGYDLDFGNETNYYQMTSIGLDENNEEIKISTIEMQITHKNIIFDCDVKVGSKNFNFINCTFNKGVEISRNYQSDDICNITFENCTFVNPKSDIVVADKNNVVYNECTFPVTAVNTNISIFSNEKGIVIINLTDVEGNPIANVEVKYNNGGENITKTTNSEGIVTVSGLTGEGEIKAYFEGNESYLKSENSYKYNFTETTPTQDTNSSTNGTSGNSTSGNGTSTTPGKTNTSTNKQTNTKVTKKATKITAKKATFKAKKKTKKYTIVLKAGKVTVKKVKVTLKVGKKTYKATTNSKGKATFNLKKLTKKGKYTAVIKFAGNKNFKATTKKVKITVKK